MLDVLALSGEDWTEGRDGHHTGLKPIPGLVLRGPSWPIPIRVTRNVVSFLATEFQSPFRCV
jgi:hypothetical protein